MNNNEHFNFVASDQVAGGNCISSDGAITANVVKEFECSRPNRVTGRYVVVTIPNQSTSLNLCEVDVFSVFECECMQLC